MEKIYVMYRLYDILLRLIKLELHYSHCQRPMIRPGVKWHKSK